MNNKTGYRQHPETKRWVGKLAALRKRHEALVKEMTNRGYVHRSPLPEVPDDTDIQDSFVNTPKEQLELLKGKPCPCPLH